MNRFLLKGLASVFALAVMFGTVSCSDDDEKEGTIAVSAVAVNPTTAAVKPGATVTLSATVTPEDATDKTITWSSSDEKVATVDGGKVTGVAEGTATITATTKSGDKTATCTVTVSEDAPAVIEDTLEGNITADRTISAANKNFLKGFVYVKSGATLTIEAGSVIKGISVASGERAASLIIEPGAKIIAEGTVDKPIVFTSDKEPGKRVTGDWGGLIICGNARVNRTNQPTIEGGPGTHYGNTTSDEFNGESSGKLKYVRIEFAGYPLEPDKEINGLTFGGVGSGTEVEFVQVSYSNDDSYEWFGGTVNAKHLIAYKGWDDDFDTDYGYTGKLQFLLSVRDKDIADTSDSNGFESDNDGDGSTNTPFTKPVFSNVTLIGPFYGKVSDRTQAEVEAKTADAANGAKGGKYQAAMHLRRNSSLNVYNSVFTGWPYGLRATDKKGQANDGIAIENVIFAGMWKNFYEDEKVSENFFNRVGNNTVLENTRQIIAKDGDYSSVVADAVKGADFSKLADSFFEKVTYKGAFDGTNDWTEGWTNWDPQNTVY
ncbi:Ig-like domain-containing protein [Parabacteroides goldsteinii]|uniref:Ig-like domain-containing protein n=1 Tax=Parabacteroides goldsteinii TaxID=328812 RepID=UPI0021662185|nr:Ig-like domain-containing protein [Parabacteroides goldsteinii]MCS2426620.1 Ig-like domain-containing protein [Parabacteroides goldsteinii]